MSRFSFPFEKKDPELAFLTPDEQKTNMQARLREVSRCVLFVKNVRPCDCFSCAQRHQKQTQARIAASRGGVTSGAAAAAAAASSPATTTAPPQQQQNQQGTLQKQVRGFDSAASPLSSSEAPSTGLSTPFASPAVTAGRRISPQNANSDGGGGSFSSGPSFLDGGVAGGKAGRGANA